MAELSKRETKAERERNRNEARVGLASNILGITAGTAALASASRNKAFRSGSVDDAGPVTRRIVHRSKGRIGPRGVGRIVRAGAAGAVGLQAANLAGDLVANRVLARESQKKVSKMVSSPDGQSVFKAVYGGGESGVGVNLESVSKKGVKCPHCELPCDKDGKCPMCGMDCSPRGGVKKADKGDKVRYAAGTAVGAAAGAGAGYGGYRYYQRLQDIVGVPRSTSSGSRRPREGSKEFKRMMRREKMGIRLQVARLKEFGAAGAARDSGRNAASRAKLAIRRMPGGRKAALVGGGLGALYGLAVVDDQTRKGVKKAYRRFDPEADRQRRMGMYVGGGAGVAALAANEARREFVITRGERPRDKGKFTSKKGPIDGIKRRPATAGMSGGSWRKAALMGALSAGGAAVSAGAYRRGRSQRNQTWM